MFELKVMEVYEACQGEGSRIGEVTTFVRLFGCNFRCAWCDTAYSINMKEWKRSYQRGPAYRLLTPQTLRTAISTHNVCVTGGEPCIHKYLINLLRYLTNAGHHITVETNASLLPRGIEAWYSETGSASQTVNVLWSLSPKLGSSLGDRWSDRIGSDRDRTWVNTGVIQWFVNHADCQLKFVISDPIDLIDFEALIQQVDFGPYRQHVPIILQPNGNVIRHAAGVDAYFQFLRDLQHKARELSKRLSLNIRALPQLHVLLHGQRRFV